MEYTSNNHWKGLLQYHIIFVCKYRRKVFINENIITDMKLIMENISKKYDFKIITQEIDSNKPDHWHGLIICEKPTISPQMIIHVLKQQSTFEIWKKYSSHLKQFYWKKHEIWTSGYFCSTIGNASSETIQKYIENQG